MAQLPVRPDRGDGPVSAEEAERLADLFEEKDPRDVLAWAFQRFGADRFVLVSSFQAEGMVLLDMAWRLRKNVRVVTVDTGRLPEETYALMDRVREVYGIGVEVLFPDPEGVASMVNRHGVNLFYQDPRLRVLCCHVRKVAPLDRFLPRVDAWATGMRREQSPTRRGIRKVALDREHGAVKLSPLADWSEAAVWRYIVDYRVPYHPLYDRGYRSIGCAPCTRPVEPEEESRSGRWWWEEGTAKECGLHHRMGLGTREDAGG